MSIRKIDAGLYVEVKEPDLLAIVELLGVSELSDDEFETYLRQLDTKP